MRFVHTADLHLGRKLNQMSLAQDMQVMLDQLVGLVVSEQASALVIAGDVFDTSVPPESAVRQWDAFVNEVVGVGSRVLVVSGNHDSGTRLAVGHELIARAGVHVAGDLAGEVVHVRIGPTDDCVTFWLMPFVRPADVRSWAAASGVDPSGAADYSLAVCLVTAAIRSHRDYLAGRNVLVAHQFVTAGSQCPERSDSERLTLGTLDNVDASVFDGFDYVALGHIHRPQRIGRDNIRYAGSPLKLSASEISSTKTFAVVDVPPSGPVEVRLVPVRPLRDFREERGGVEELVSRGADEPEEKRGDFIRAVVTDDDPIDVVTRLRRVWPNLAQIDFDNASTRALGAQAIASIEEATADVSELFSAFFCDQAGRDLTIDERNLVNDMLESVSRGGDAS